MNKKLHIKNRLFGQTIAETLVDSETGEIFVADAGDYVNPGQLHCYSADGKRQWAATTGIIPGHMAFTTTALKGLQ